MGLFNKLKTVLFTEEEETTEIPLIQKEEYKEEEKNTVEEEISRFNNIRIEENINKVEEKPKPIIEEKQEEVKPKPATKSPFQSFDEEEFDRIAAINKNRLLERDRRAREEKERQNRHTYEEPRVEVRLPKEETHKFKPTPVISPVYGILDKNYSKEDILPTASSEGTLPKIIDVDSVRQKAFGTLDKIGKSLEEDSLDNIKITSFDEDDTQKIEIPKIEEIEDETEITTPLPKIEEVEKELEIEDIVSPEEDEIKPVLNDIEEKDSKIESDLFNLIDSMYLEEGDK